MKNKLYILNNKPIIAYAQKNIMKMSVNGPTFTDIKSTQFVLKKLY